MSQQGTTVAVAVFVAVFAPVITVLLLQLLTGRQRRAEKREDYKRQDEVALRAQNAANALVTQQQQVASAAAALVKEVAAQAETAARKLQNAQQATIARTDEVARLAELRADRSDEKLDQIDLQARRIHTLVNSDMTAARQSELDTTRVIVAVLRRVIALARDRGIQPDPKDVDALDAAERRAVELEQILADRLSQMRQVEADQVLNPIKDNNASAQGGER
jgi:hypothetical protein